MIALIDYKAGNLTSVRKALSAVEADVFTPDEPNDLPRAAGIIVPGVGHFAATAALDEEWLTVIRRLVNEGRPLLGICLGMQWLFEGSEESPELPGLGVLKGHCYRLGRVRPPASAGSALRLGHAVASGGGGKADTTTPNHAVKVPHVGWNTLEVKNPGSIIEGVANGSQVYFTHSYVAPITRETVAATSHGEPFASIVQCGHIAGVQFHPEKSGDVGLRILRNWIRMA